LTIGVLKKIAMKDRARINATAVRTLKRRTRGSVLAVPDDDAG
jgi:hypothetical protein